jgi:dihydroorotase
MHEPRPILLAKARLIDPSRDLDTRGDILIADGVIKDIAPNLADGLPPETEIVDCRRLVAVPGLVDMRAFIGEPGA